MFVLRPYKTQIHGVRGTQNFVLNPKLYKTIIRLEILLRMFVIQKVHISPVGMQPLHLMSRISCLLARRWYNFHLFLWQM
jgi:hypothetical protein